jgi:hypothetical protein
MSMGACWSVMVYRLDWWLIESILIACEKGDLQLGPGTRARAGEGGVPSAHRRA